MDSAEVYMSLIRPTGIPIVGEAAPIEFKSQIDVTDWTWTMRNHDEMKREEKAESDYNEAGEKFSNRTHARALSEVEKQMAELEADEEYDELRDSLDKLKRSTEDTKEERDAAIADMEKDLRNFGKTRKDKLDVVSKSLRQRLGQQNADERRDSEKEEQRAQKRRYLTQQTEEITRNKNFEFSFAKRVDFATTQMLNSMKSGDLFPTAILTLHQRSANAGLSLVITVMKLRLLDYQIRVDASDTMTDLREVWKAEFESIGYVYKNRKAINKSSSDVGSAAMLASQGTVRTFAMKKLLGF